jgi:hypothetical protein
MLIPMRQEDITAEWLDGLLRRSGSALPRVKRLRATPLPGGYGFMAQTFRLEMEWHSGAGAPATLIAKLPVPERLPELEPGHRRMFRREAMFHRDVAPGAPIHTARAYAAELDPNTGTSVLVFEDLQALTACTDSESLSFERVEACLTQLAALHARYWQSAKLASMGWLAHPAKTRVDEVPVSDFRRGWPRLAASGAYELSRIHLRLGELLSERMDGVYDALHAAPETLAHADLHQENLFFDGDEPTFIDWQHTARAAGAYDVAKLTASCLEPGKFASEQPRLMQHYFEELQRRGVAGYSMPELERDVHFATCHYVASLLFLDERDFAALRGNTARQDFTSQRVLASSGRDEVVAVVEGL